MARNRPTGPKQDPNQADDEEGTPGAGTPAAAPPSDGAPEAKQQVVIDDTEHCGPQVDMTPTLEAKEINITELGPREPVLVQRWRVTRGGRVHLAKGFAIIRTGKVIDERGYDIKRLRDQGILLEDAGMAE